jgi:hypothetical protein
MRVPEPPDHVWEDARPAWYRIIGRLQKRGQWEPVYEMMTALTAIQCALYLRLAKVPQLTEQCEASRQLARELLYQMGCLTKERIPLALLDDDGRDADLAKICGPIAESAEDTTGSVQETARFLTE